MKRNVFAQPVWVLVGLGFSREVPTVMDAYQLVAEWPGAVAKATRRRTLMACRAVLNGGDSPDAAREAFLDFAEEAGILFSQQGVETASPQLAMISTTPDLLSAHSPK